jgi:hypothetical protein
MAMPIYPTEIWISVLMLMFIFMFMGVMMFGPFIPFVLAKFSKKKLLLMIDKTGQLKLKKADIRNGMYFFGDNPMRFVKQYHGSYKLAGVDTDIVHMDLGFVLKPEFQAAIKELEEEYDIKDYKELQEAVDAGRIKKNELDIPLFFTLPVDDMIDYAAEVPPASITGEVSDLIEMQKLDPSGAFGKWIPWVVLAIIALMGGAIAYQIVVS